MVKERNDTSFLEEGPRIVLQQDASVSGKLVFDLPVKIDGRFKGEVKANALLVLGPHAEVAAKISAGQLRIEGSLIGTVRVNGWIEIMPGGRFQGEIESGKLKVYAGGVFEGKGEIGVAQPASSSESRAPLPERFLK
jgi:cytoskeletal protein CcmA (bactofilin family)